MDNFSRKLSHTLDYLGYSHDIVQFRRKRWQWHMSRASSGPKESTIVLAGSKAEGITSVFESDFDFMVLYDDVLCINIRDQIASELPDKTIVLQADTEKVPPGYTRLKLYKPSSPRNVMDPYIRECFLETQSGQVYMSSDLATSGLRYNFESESDDSDFVCHDVTGPSQPVTFLEYEADMVAGLSCHCPQFLQKWASRRRQHEWPSDDTIRTACSFLPQVVPVGAKGSDRQGQEWRFCFIESELALTNSLNGTQIKLYIVLKMIAKQILKVVADEISSYIMKNVTYWLSELLPLQVFREEKLAWLVLVGLATLRSAITRWENLPYYVIPSRNLLLERLDASTQSKLSDLLWMLIREGPFLFLRLDKLKEGLEATYLSRANIVELGNIRDRVEKIYLTRRQAKRKHLHSLVVSYKRLQDPAWKDELSYEEVIQATKSILS